MRSGPCTQQPTRSVGPPRSQNRGISALLPIIAVLILLPTIAFASPPDPSWIAGTYDDADGDDIVMRVYESAPAGSAPTVADVTLSPCRPKLSVERVPGCGPDHRSTGS